MTMKKSPAQAHCFGPSWMQPGRPADWVLKVSAGVGLGFTLAILCGGLFRHLAPVWTGQFQLVMWVVPPVWLVVASLVFLFRTGMRAWLWLAAANGVAYGLLILLGTGRVSP